MAIGGKRVLAIIPARGGSKRFPGKNLALFHGEPLVVIAVEQALASRYVDSVVVSSDSDEILWACVGFERTHALKRPTELSTDESPTEDAIKHALAHHPCDLFVVLQPTSPTRSIEDIDGCLLNAAEYDACYTVVYSLAPNGAAYACTPEHFVQHGLCNFATPYGMPPERSHDINTPQDLETAQKASDAR